MPSPDPWHILGVPPGSSLAEARTARRRLAKQLHPDVHGGQADLSARMTTVNQALAEIETYWEKGPPGPAVGATVPVRRTASPPGPPPGAGRPPLHPGADDDPDSFSLDWLPAEAFEALFLAAYGLGDILVADEPYLLEIYLAEPPCFCRLRLVPEAGGSLVTVEVSPAADGCPTPHPHAVIEVLATELLALWSG